MTDLNVRMSLTVPDQLTWADPEKGKKCFQCKHVVKAPASEVLQKNRLSTHRCGLYKLHTGQKKSPLFNPVTAIACSKYDF